MRVAYADMVECVCACRSDLALEVRGTAKAQGESAGHFLFATLPDICDLSQ